MARIPVTITPKLFIPNKDTRKLAAPDPFLRSFIGDYGTDMRAIERWANSLKGTGTGGGGSTMEWALYHVTAPTVAPLSFTGGAVHAHKLATFASTRTTGSTGFNPANFSLVSTPGSIPYIKVTASSSFFIIAVMSGYMDVSYTGGTAYMTRYHMTTPGNILGHAHGSGGIVTFNLATSKRITWTCQGTAIGSTSMALHPVTTFDLGPTPATFTSAWQWEAQVLVVAP